MATIYSLKIKPLAGKEKAMRLARLCKAIESGVYECDLLDRGFARTEIDKAREHLRKRVKEKEARA